MHEILNQGAFSLFFIRTSRAMWEYQSEIRTKSLKIDHAHIEVLSDFCFIHFYAHICHKLGRAQAAHLVSSDFSLCIIYC